MISGKTVVRGSFVAETGGGAAFLTFHPPRFEVGDDKIARFWQSRQWSRIILPRSQGMDARTQVDTQVVGALPVLAAVLEKWGLREVVD